PDDRGPQIVRDLGSVPAPDRAAAQLSRGDRRSVQYGPAAASAAGAAEGDPGDRAPPAAKGTRRAAAARPARSADSRLANPERRLVCRIRHPRAGGGPAILSRALAKAAGFPLPRE